MNFKALINEICCDDRIKNGVFDIKNPDHVFIMQEYLEKRGYNLDTIVDKTAKLFEAGRFPERQAYNKDGILVTFPTKEYRDRAINKGTHFAENPKKAQANIFSTPTSDVENDVSPPEDETGSVTLDAELDKGGPEVEKNSYVDRTPKEKVIDAATVDQILTGESPLTNYSIDEAKRYGFYNKGTRWYDSNGNLVGEQLYDEKVGHRIFFLREEVNKKYSPKYFEIAKDNLFYEPITGIGPNNETISPEEYFKQIFETTDFENFKFPRGRDVQYNFKTLDDYLRNNTVTIVPASTYVKIRSMNDERLIQFKKKDAATVAALSLLYSRRQSKFLTRGDSDLDKSCPATKMESFINDEMNNPKGSGNAIAKKIADKLKSGDYKDISVPVTRFKLMGSSTCNLSDEFAGISKISKTDLILNGDIRCSAKKAGGSQVASAQSRELTTVFSVVVSEFPEIERKIIADITETIGQLLEKSFYYNNKSVIDRNLTVIAKSNDSVKVKDAVRNLTDLVKSPESNTQLNLTESEMKDILQSLNSIFLDEKYKKALLREFATGTKRFKSGEECVATHIMSWDCQGDCVIYPVDDFINQNFNKVKFGFRDRGNKRGGSFRIDILKEEFDEVDISLNEQQLMQENLIDFLQNIGNELKATLQTTLDFMKNLSTSAKNALNVFIIKFKESIRRYLMKITLFIKKILDRGFNYFVEYFDIDSKIEGDFEFEIP